MSVTLSVAEIGERDAKERPAFCVTWRPALYQWRTQLNEALKTSRVSPNMLAAIGARETNGLNIFQYGMPHSPGCGVGVWQITSGVDWSNPQQPSYPGYGSLLDVAIGARVASEVFLEPLLEQFPSSHLAAFAGFNLGGGGVAEELSKGLDPDSWTTDHDYGLTVFTDWINFSAVSFGVNVDWASWQGR